MAKLTLIPIILSLLMLAGCTDTTELGPAPIPENYAEKVEEWKEYRVGVLKGPTDWLRLDGIHWLEEGENRFGSGADQDLQFPEGSIPKHAGIFTLENGQIYMETAADLVVTHEGETVQKMTLFDGENRPRIKYEQLEWFIDSRGDDHGVRLYNKDNPEADAFEGFPFYPLDPQWHLKARFIPNPEENSTISVINVLGETVERESPGVVEFKIDGELYSLDAFEARSGLFLIFSDETNRSETYQAGRYMIIDFADEDGFTIIDFNRAYNMPCAFNKYTTCQLPPAQNRLNVSITAGEKRPVGWEGL